MGISMLMSCSPSYKVNEQEFINAINLKDVKRIQRIQQIPSGVLTWQIADNICHETEERKDSYLERYIVPKEGTTDICIIKKRTSKTATNWTTEENKLSLWFKTVESEDVMPAKILKNLVGDEFVTYTNYAFDNAANTYNCKIGSDISYRKAAIKFTNGKVTNLQAGSKNGGITFSQTIEFKYDNITPVFPQ